MIGELATTSGAKVKKMAGQLFRRGYFAWLAGLPVAFFGRAERAGRAGWAWAGALSVVFASLGGAGRWGGAVESLGGRAVQNAGGRPGVAGRFCAISGGPGRGRRANACAEC